MRDNIQLKFGCVFVFSRLWRHCARRQTATGSSSSCESQESTAWKVMLCCCCCCLPASCWIDGLKATQCETSNHPSVDSHAHPHAHAHTFAVWQPTAGNSFNNFQCLSIVHNLNVHANIFLCIYRTCTHTHAHAQLCSKLSFLLPLAAIVAAMLHFVLFNLPCPALYTFKTERDERWKSKSSFVCVYHTHTH